MQMANYVTTIANNGKHGVLTLLKSLKSADYSETTYSHVPVYDRTLPDYDFISYLKEGMRAVVTGGTAKTVFGTYPVRVAAKTGTVQMSTSEINNGVFVCYAPADDPQIAIAVVVEKGGSGAAIMEIAKAVLDEYFQTETYFDVSGDGLLIP
jgi:penicillin-binding protein 2